MSNDMMGQLLATEANLMEMSECEYTHLQLHLLQTQMDGQAADHHHHDGADVRYPAAMFGLGVASAQPAATAKYDPGSASKMCASPTVQAMDLSTSNDEQCVIADLRLNETVDIEELAMVISGGGPSGEKTPTTCGEVPGSVLVRVKREAGEAPNEAPAHGCGSSLNRPHSSARVCLEKRFSCMAEDVPRQQDTQTAVLTNFLTMLQQSTESQEASIHPQMQKWMKADRANPIELSNPYGGALFNPITGVCEAFGHISHVVEPNKHQGLINANSFLGYRPERAAAKGQCVSRTNHTEEQEWVKVEKEAVHAAPVKRTRSRILRGPNVGPQLEGPRVAVEAGRSGRKTAGNPAESSQRREKHNSKERDRRRRIRMCCNELNTLVPFCKQDTDKASTLQWTVAYLKYIKEVYRESPSKSFESTFCGKTGLRTKPRTDSDHVHVHQEMAGTASTALATEQ